MRNHLRNFLRRSIPLITCGLIFVIAPFAHAMPNPHVADNAHYFSADAISKADAIIAQIKKDSGKDFFFDTEPAIPDSMKSNYQPAQREQFFDAWADQLGQANEVNGIVVLFCREPSHLQVRVGRDTFRQAFIQSNANELSTKLITHFKAKDFDGGLLAGVQYVQSTLAQSLPHGGTAMNAPANGAKTPDESASPANSTYPPMVQSQGQSQSQSQGQTQNAPIVLPNQTGGRSFGIGSLLCVGLGIFLFFTLLRGMFGSRGGPSYGAGYGGGGPGGGGMGRGFLGGILGGLLGGYAADRFSHRNEDGGFFGGGGTPGGGNIGGGDAGGNFGGGGGGDFGGGGGGGAGGDV